MPKFCVHCRLFFSVSLFSLKLSFFGLCSSSSFSGSATAAVVIVWGFKHLCSHTHTERKGDDETSVHTTPPKRVEISMWFGKERRKKLNKKENKIKLKTHSQSLVLTSIYLLPSKCFRCCCCSFFYRSFVRFVKHIYTDARCCYKFFLVLFVCFAFYHSVVISSCVCCYTRAINFAQIFAKHLTWILNCILCVSSSCLVYLPKHREANTQQ